MSRSGYDRYEIIDGEGPGDLAGRKLVRVRWYPAGHSASRTHPIVIKTAFSSDSAGEEVALTRENAVKLVNILLQMIAEDRDGE